MQNKKFNIFFLLIFLAINAISQNQEKEINQVTELIDRVVKWQNKQTDHVDKYTLTNWQFAAYYIGLMKAFKTTNKTEYQSHLYKIGMEHRWETIPDMYHGDKIAIGQVYLDLYDQKGRGAMIKNLKWVLDAHLMRKKPTPDVRYDKNLYKHEWWSWCDALFMAPPTFAKMYQMTGDEAYLDYAIDHWLITTDYLWDKEENLIYRDDRYFGKTTKAGKKIFWGRGNGWVYGGLVHMLEIIPKGHPKRNLLLDQFIGMSEALLENQKSDGLWRANLLDPGVFAFLDNKTGALVHSISPVDVPENSGSSFFCYGFAWGVNQGILSKDKYLSPMLSAWNGLKQYVNKAGRLGYVQSVGKDPKPFDAHSWQEFGTGAFLLAASEYINYLKTISDDKISFKKGNVFYENNLSDASKIQDWSMEGEGSVLFKSGWMEMFSLKEASHHVFWCPKDLPTNFVAEWEVQNIDTDSGLCIIFFSAKGENGEDIFDPNLKKRTGIFRQYTKSDLNNYHISYYANAPNKPKRPFSHLRKNKGFVKVHVGRPGIPSNSKEVHKIQLIKKNNHIVMHLDGKIIIDWKDDGESFGSVLGSGKFAFRQMQWTRFRYRNLKIWELKS